MINNMLYYRLLISPQNIQQVRQLNSSTLRNAARRNNRNRSPNRPPDPPTPTFRERLLGPSSSKTFIYVTSALAGTSALGVGMLCYYGLTKGAASAATHSLLWPDYVRRRLYSTYAYLAGSLTITGLTGFCISKIQIFMALFSGGSTLKLWIGFVVALNVICGVLRSIDYATWPITKHLVWILQCAQLGAILAPICCMGGPLFMKAAWYTAALVGVLSLVTMCSPSEQFLNMAGPLGMGLAVFFVTQLGAIKFRSNPVVRLGTSSILVYGGLILFSAYLFYNTKEAIKLAEEYPVSLEEYRVSSEDQEQAADDDESQNSRQYDPINAQLTNNVSIVNIFIAFHLIFTMFG